MNEWKRCPFLVTHPYLECVYIVNGYLCDDIGICPGNSDAWCLSKIEQADRRAPDPEKAELVAALRETNRFLLSYDGVRGFCDHTGAMNATQLGRHEWYRRLLDHIQALLRRIEGGK